MNFEFATAGRIIFGCGRINIVGEEVEKLGRKAFIVTGKSMKRVEPLLKILNEKNIDYQIFNVATEPTTDIVKEAALKADGFDFVIAMGGGSVIDTGKAVSALMTNKGDLMDYLEVIGEGRALVNKTKPFIAIPTTSGTGTEVTKNSVIGSKEYKVKVSMRSPYMMPDLAIVDPELTLNLSPELTAVTGLDALTHLIEAFVSNKSNPMTDSLCLEGVKRCSKSLIKAYVNGSDIKAREDMCFASLVSGIVLANAGLGAVHGFAGPIGGMINAPHGAICAALLPHVMEVNIKALKNTMPHSELFEKYNQLAAILTNDRNAVSGDCSVWIRELCSRLETKGLLDLGFKKEQINDAVEKGSRASSMKGNPVELSNDDLKKILNMSL